MEEDFLSPVVTPFDTVEEERNVFDQLRSLHEEYLTEERAIVPTPVQAFGQSNIEFGQYNKEVQAKDMQAKEVVQDKVSRNELYLTTLYGRESNPRKGENHLHSGLEGRGKTSQYGVRQNDFPLLKGESYKQQAQRVLDKKLYKVGSRNPAFKEASGELQASLVPVMWNLGENSGAIRKFDYSNVKGSAARIMQYFKYTPQGQKKRVPSKGLMNARVKDWNAIAETPEGIEAGMYPITKYEDYKQQV